MRELRFIYILLLIFVGIQLRAQKREVARLASRADSLSFCGYFDQEIEVRNKLLVSLNQSSSEFNKQKLLLQIANYNHADETRTDTIKDKEFRAIVKQYQLFPQKERKDIAVVVGRLIALKLNELDRSDEAISLLEKLLKGVKKQSVDAATLSLNIGQTLLNNQRKYYESIAYFKDAIAGFESNNMANHYGNALAYSELSFSYDRAEVENFMFECSEKALKIWSMYYFKDAEIVSTAYNNMLADMIDYGDRYAARKYQKAYETYINDYLRNDKRNYLQNLDEFSLLGLYYLTTAKFYAFEFDAQKLRQSVKDQEQLFSRAPKSWKEKEGQLLLSTYDSACYGFYYNYESVEALRYNAIMEQNANHDFYRMKAEANRAMLNYYKYEYAKALIHTEKSLSYLELLGYRSSYKTLLTLKAELLANLGRIADSKETLTELYQLQFDENFNFENIKIAEYKDVASASDINILVHSGLAYRAIFEKNGREKSDLAVMKNFYRVAAQMFQKYYLKGIFNPDLEKQLNNIKEGLYFGYLQDPTDQKFLTESINYIENNSSQHLWQQFIAKHGQNLNLPSGLLNNRNALSMQLTFYQNKGEPTPAEQQKIAQLDTELKAVEKKMEIANPNYKRYSYDNFDINELQKSTILANGELVKFAITDSSVYAHKISNKTSELVFLGKRKVIENEVKDYYEKLRSIDFTYQNQGKKLHDILLKPLHLQSEDKIIIIAEGFLNYLPFETLIPETNHSGKIPIISYANSLKFVTYEPEKNTRSFTDFFSGFAPEYKSKSVASRADNGQLIYTGKELLEIAKTIGRATVFIKEKATKQNFINSLGKSNIHHLAMHSLIDEADYNYSSLIFQNDEKVYFHELYNLNFPSEMVVLSACNTGIGQYLSGEGLMSMSRALNYAGVKATVYSLWQVPDKETSDLMVLFYKNIDRGLQKDEALAAAKQEFIAEFPTKSHPYYWAGFVLNGDVSAIHAKNYLWYAFGGFLLLLITFFLFRKRLLH